MKNLAKKVVLGCVAAIALTGCITVEAPPPTSDPLMEQRLRTLEALLEQSLAAQAAGNAATEDTAEDRLARIEEQVSQVTQSLNAYQQNSGIVQDSAQSGSAIVLQSDYERFPKKAPSKGRTKFVTSLVSDFESGTKGTKYNARGEELLGFPLPQTRFLGPHGGVVNLDDFIGNKKVVLVMMRGFSGQVCPGCQAQTIALDRRYEEFVDRDAQILLVYPGPIQSVPTFIESISNFEEDFQLNFPVLLDVNLRAVKKLDIEAKLADPSTFVIDEGGIVRWAYIGKSFDDRPSVDTVLDAIDQNT